MSFFWVGHFEFFFSKKKIFFCFIPMKISPNLYGRMDGSKFWCFPWFPENSLLCVILRYTVYIGTNIKYCVNNLSKIKSSILKAKIYWFQVNLKVSSYPLKYVQCFLHKNWCVLECFNGKPETQSNISWILFNCKKSLQFYLP